MAYRLNDSWKDAVTSTWACCLVSIYPTQRTTLLGILHIDSNIHLKTEVRKMRKVTEVQITCKQSTVAVAGEQWTSLAQSSYEVEPSQIFGIYLHSCGWLNALSSTPSAVPLSQPKDSVIEDKHEECLSLKFKWFVLIFCLCTLQTPPDSRRSYK